MSAMIRFLAIDIYGSILANTSFYYCKILPLLQFCIGCSALKQVIVVIYKSYYILYFLFRVVGSVRYTFRKPGNYHITLVFFCIASLSEMDEWNSILRIFLSINFFAFLYYERIQTTISLRTIPNKKLFVHIFVAIGVKSSA